MHINRRNPLCLQSAASNSNLKEDKLYLRNTSRKVGHRMDCATHLRPRSVRSQLSKLFNDRHDKPDRLTSRHPRNVSPSLHLMARKRQRKLPSHPRELDR